jgi:hypothetical protein
MKWVQTGEVLIIGEGDSGQCASGVEFTSDSHIDNRTIEIQVHSHRIETVKFDIGTKTSILIVQLYAPHNDYGMDEIEKFDSKIEIYLD